LEVGVDVRSAAEKEEKPKIRPNRPRWDTQRRRSNRSHRPKV
jgi:hypothetical protein